MSVCPYRRNGECGRGCRGFNCFWREDERPQSAPINPDVLDGVKILKMAKIQTILDCVTLLGDLRATSVAGNYQRIDDMMQRLTTMATTL